MIRLVAYHEDSVVAEYEQSDLTKEITIGRAPGCILHLDEPSVSRLHALIHNKNGQWVLERKANFGAVLLNGHEVENASLQGGEDIRVGGFNIRVDITPEKAAGKTTSGSGVTSSVKKEETGRTRMMPGGVVALFRFEPGASNVDDFRMEAETVVFGRGSNCDVVLTEKKASRKQCEVRRQGMSFFLKDLESANGTRVNGKNVSEVELVPGDTIEIGECKIQFSIENKEFFSQRDAFLPVPSFLEEPDGPDPLAGGEQPRLTGPIAEGAELGDVPGLESAAEEEEVPKTLMGKLRKRYLAMTLRQRVLFIGIVFAFIVAILGAPDEEKKKPPKKPPVIVNGKQMRTIDLLTPEKQKFVKQTYDELLKSYEKRDYPRMLDSAGKVLTYVDEYKDTKSYEVIAKKGIEELEEARRQDELKKRQDKIRADVAALEEKGRNLFAQALKDAKYRAELDSMIQQIYAKDPNNKVVLEWKSKIAEKIEEEKREAEVIRKRAELKDRAEAAFAAVEKTFQSDRYLKALAEAEKLTEVGYSEKEYLDRIEELKTKIREKLSSVIDPKLKEAENQRGEGGDLVRAKELYLEVLKTDPENPKARAGLDQIRETLHLRAKRFYAEAVLAESIADLTEAKDRYEKCLHTAPDEDIYKQRCRNKLSRFEAFSNIGNGPGTPGGL